MALAPEQFGKSSVRSGTGPLRLALLKERADALLRVAGEHVFDHHACRVIISFGERHLGLTIEGLLADCERKRRLARDLVRHLDGG